MAQAQLPAIKRRGNPNFGKDKTEQTPQEVKEVDLNKQYIFQLIKTHDSAKPVDSKNGEKVNSAYQPYFGVVNSGMAYDPEYQPKNSTKKGGVRNWRYIYNYPTIWVNEQIDPEPTKEDLAAPENYLTFRNGLLRVFGHEEMKLKALQLNNAFQDCARPLKNIPKEYVLLNQDKIDKEVLQSLDDSFEAEKAAREASLDDMYAVAYYFGIDLTKSDDAIRKEFIQKARNNPKVFNREFVNPKNRVKYAILSALAENYISDIIVPLTVYFVDSNTKVLDLKSQDTAEEIANLYIAGNQKAIDLYNKVKKFLDDGAE